MSTIIKVTDLLKTIKSLKDQVDLLETDVTGLVGTKVALHEENLNMQNRLDELDNKLTSLSTKVNKYK